MQSSTFIRTTIGLLALAMTAVAGQITYTVDTGFQSTDNQTQFNFPQFDPINGTLQSIDFTLQGYGDALFALTNFTANGSLYAITAGVSLGLQDPTCAPACLLPLISVNATSNLFTFLPSGGTTGSQERFPNSAISGPGPLNCSSYGALCTFLSGTATVLDVIDMRDISSVTGEEPLTFTETAAGKALITITYNYTSNAISEVTAVPEPLSMALVGAGLIGLALGVRKHRKS